MLLTWVDLLIVIVVAVVVLFEVRRDFGQGLFDTLAVLVSLRAGLWIYPFAAEAVPLAARDTTNKGIWILLSFALCTAGALVVSRRAHEATQWSLETFDPAFGFVFGVTAAVMISHVLVKGVVAFYAVKQGMPACVADSALGGELLTFKSYHALRDWIFQFNHRI
jgi:uncharacterized membrane protein required for colicin V production